jgi:hypothetical protein
MVELNQLTLGAWVSVREYYFNLATIILGPLCVLLVVRVAGAFVLLRKRSPTHCVQHLLLVVGHWALTRYLLMRLILLKFLEEAFWLLRKRATAATWGQRNVAILGYLVRIYADVGLGSYMILIRDLDLIWLLSGNHPHHHKLLLRDWLLITSYSHFKLMLGSTLELGRREWFIAKHFLLLLLKCLHLFSCRWRE